MRYGLLVALAPLGSALLAPTRSLAQRRAIVVDESLGEGLFRQAFGGLGDMVKRVGAVVEEEKAAKVAPVGSDVTAGREAARAKRGVISGIDARAQAGEVTFDDLLQVGRTFREFKGNPPGMPGTLSAKQVEETMEKFATHEKIVLAMTDEERADPELMMADLTNTDQKLPRTQRLARAADVSEKAVALFMAEFEAMRQSTQRIAAGEDPDAVNNDIGSSNRAARRAAKKGAAKKGKK